MKQKEELTGKELTLFSHQNGSIQKKTTPYNIMVLVTYVINEIGLQ